MKSLISCIALLLPLPTIALSSISPTTQPIPDPLDALSGEVFTKAWQQNPVEADILPFFGYANSGVEYYYYKGDTAEVNRFLSRCEATVEAIPTGGWFSRVTSVVVTVHAGVGFAQLPWEAEAKAERRAQWKLEIVPNAEAGSDAGSVTNTVSINIHVWIDDRVRLDELQIPERFTLMSGGELESFISRRRKSAEQRAGDD